MLVNKLGVDGLLLMLCRLRFCMSFHRLSNLVLSKLFLNSELVLVVKVQFLYNVIHQVDY